jgi:tRNA(adenine34) deaminase
VTDAEAMAVALEEATLALDHDDVPVGAVVLVGGNVVAQRHNERELRKDPTAHAEILALQDAAGLLGTWHLDDANHEIDVSRGVSAVRAGTLLQDFFANRRDIVG